ncbi:extracellular ligand-binding receptor [Streptomyces sp. W007]|nr:extracellular ligand-binding receptor [Streptomyces sp. W007]
MAGRRIALLVATDGYADPGLNQLRSPVRGAGELEGLLKDESVGRFDSVRTLTNRPKDEVERQIESVLSNREPDDLVLLYLSCHGIRTDSGRLFFATVSTDLSLPQSTAVRAELIHHLLDECEARTKIVLLDCCYSGLFHQGTPMSPAPVDVKGALAGRGTFVITASTSLEYAYEGRQLTLDNSLPSARFTAAINEGLRTGQADLDHDGVITPDELYTYVHAAVVNQSGPEQTPTKSGQCEGNVPLAYAAQIDRSTGRPVQGGRPAELLLGALLPPPVDTADRGFICDSWEGASRLLVPIGRGATSSGGQLMCLDLAGRSGNAAVVGRLGSGKTTLLRVLTMSLALTHTPREAEFYLLEGAVNRLGVLRSMPHVKKVAAAHEHGAVAEVLTALDDAIATRRMLFRDLGIDSVEEFRRLRGTGKVPSDRSSDVFLVIDGWVDFGWEIPDFATKIHRLVNSGLNYGVHLLASARQWNDFDPTLLGLLGSRVELALDDPEDSRVDSSLSAGLSTGWALAHRRRFRVALPHLEEAAGSAEARQALAETNPADAETLARSAAGHRRDIQDGGGVRRALRYHGRRAVRRPPGLAAPTAGRRAAGTDRPDRNGRTSRARPEGRVAGRDGPPRSLRRHRGFWTDRTSAHPDPGPRGHALPGRTELPPGRPRRRRRLRRAAGPSPHLGPHHRSLPRSDTRETDDGRHQRRAVKASGVDPLLGRPCHAPRLRQRTCGRHGTGAPSLLADRRRRLRRTP